MATFTIKSGDTLPNVVATLINPFGIPVNLVGSTVEFRMESLDGRLIFSRPTTEVDPRNGRVSYLWQSGDTSNAGTFRAEFRVTNPQGKIETYPNNGYITVEMI